MESPISYGTGVSLRLPVDNAMYLASPGMADPHIILRYRESDDAPILQFDRCVFNFQPANLPAKRGMGEQQKDSGRHRVTYGKVVHLVHQYSGLYVTVVRKPNEANPNHFRVTLMTLEDAGSACRFRIMPRYKIRAEGDKVLDKDMIFLQQDNSTLCLHAPLNAAGLPDDTMEISSYDTPTPFEILIYEDSHEAEDERHPTINAGVATLIFHREKDALLTLPSSGSVPAKTKPDGSPSSPHLAPNTPYLSHMEKPVQNLSVEDLVFGCSALWFFEHCDTTVGGPITANAPFRIRNGVTGMYLAATRSNMSSTFTVQLVNLDTPENLQASMMEVELVSALDSLDKIYSTKSFIKLKHRASNMYLSTAKAGSLTSTICLSHRSNLEDTLAVVTVPRSRQQELSFLIGNVEFLSHYISRFYQMQESNSPLQPKDPAVARVVNRAAVSLSALIRFCTESEEENPLEREGIPINEHQQSMFEVNLHRTVMEVLLCPFVGAKKENKMELPLSGGVLKMEDILKEDFAHIHNVCRLCYRLLKQMSKGSPYAVHLVEYVGFMQAQEGYKLHVADTLMEIFTNNPNLPQSRCETDIRHFVHMLLTKGQSAGYLKFLSKLCVVNDTGVLYNQRLVCHLLLEQHRDDILQLQREKDGQLMVLVKPKKDKKKKDDITAPPIDMTPKWTPLGQFLNSGDKKAVKFFESSVEVLGALCIGADDQILGAVASFLPMEVISLAIDPSFPASEGLRASYFRVSLHLYLRKSLRDSAHHNARLHFTCGSLVLPSTEAEAEIKALVKSKEGSASKMDPQDESFITTIKNQSLVYFAKYKSVTGKEGINELILTLSYIWHAMVTHHAFTRDELIQVCGAMTAVLDGTTDNVAEDRYANSEKNAMIMRTKRGLLDFLKTVLASETNRISDNVVVHLKCMATIPAIKEAEESLKELNDGVFKTDVLFPILTDMIHYHDRELVSRALDLLVSICNAGGTIATRISDAEPVSTPQAVNAFKCFANVFVALGRNMSSSGNIIDEEELICTIREVTHFDPSAQVATPTTPRTRAASTGPKKRLAAKISTIIAMNRVLTSVQGKRTKWRNEDDVVLEYARLLYRSGIHTYLFRAFRSAAEGSELQAALLEFFRVLSTAPASAIELSKHINVFVNCLRHPTTTSDAAAIILRLLKTNKTLAAELDESTIVQFVHQLKIKSDVSIAEGLEHLVLGEFPILRNQRLVLSLLVSNGLVKSVGDADKGWPAAQLAFNSSIVDLMACCCVGNGTARSIATTILRAEDVMKVLIADSLPAAHLCPYFKFLCTAFLSSEDECTAQELVQLKRQWTENSMWWSLVQSVVLKKLVVPEGGIAMSEEELMFTGMLPVITSFFNNLYDAAFAAKSNVALPLSEITKKFSAFAQQILALDNPINEAYMTALHQALSALRDHVAATSVADLKMQFEDTFAKVTQMLNKLSASAEDEKASTSRKKMDGAEKFAERWIPFSETLLRPLIDLYKGTEEIQKIPQVDVPLHKRHQKIIQHLFRGDLTTDATVGVVATMRYVLSELEGEKNHVDAQVYFNSIGALRMCTEVVTGSSDEVVMEAFKLAIAILEGGNTAVQDHLLNFFSSTDERFFHETTGLIHRSIEASQQHRAREVHGTFYSRTRNRKLHFKFILEIFRFLQLMCEGHHLGLQNYLRDQLDNLRSVNVVRDVVLFLQELATGDIDVDHYPVLLQTLALLTEFCQGPCVGNQQLIVSLGTCATINQLLQIPVKFPLEDEHDQTVMEIKQNAVTTLLALLEGCTGAALPLAIMNEVPVKSIHDVLVPLLESEEFKQNDDETTCEAVYGMFILLHTLVRSVDDKHNRDCLEAEHVLNKYASSIGMLGKIEIERGERIENVYFRVPTICSMLTEEAKQKLLWTVDRSGQGSKLSDFLDKTDELIFDMEAAHNVTEQLQHNKALLLFSQVGLGTYDNISLLIAILINILFVVVIQDAKGLMDTNVDWLGVEGFIRLLAYLQCFVCVIISSLDGFLNFPLVLYKQSKEIADASLAQKATAIISRSETTYRFASMLFAFAGLFVSDFFFAFHLLGLIGKSSVLLNVIVAVTTNGKSLLLTGLLGCIFVYLFSILGFVMFQEHFDDACHTLSACVLHILTTGLRQGGGIGDAMEAVKHDNTQYLSRMLYDFAFWAMMIVIFLNILFGIIIDTFAELRDEKGKKEEDMHSKCFVCGIDSYTFDRYGEGFEKHVKEEHNMWQYLYFMHHLRRKEETEYTGQESYVAECIKNGDIAFFPAGKCSSLKDMPKQTENGDDSDDEDTTAVTVNKGSSNSNTNNTQQSPAQTMEESFALTTANNEATTNMLNKILTKVEALNQQREQPGPVGFSLSRANFSPDDHGRVSPALESSMNASPLGGNQAAPDFQQLQQQQQLQMMIRQMSSDAENLKRNHAAGIAVIHSEYQHSCGMLVDHLAVLSSLYVQYEARMETFYTENASSLHKHLVQATLGLAAKVEHLLAQVDGLHELRNKERMLLVEQSDAARTPSEKSTAAVGSGMVDVMQEGQNYLRLMRQLTQEGRALQKSTEKSAPH